LPTIQFLREKKVKKIILISHLGQPISSNEKQFSLEPIANYLEKLLGRKDIFYNNIDWKRARKRKLKSYRMVQ